MGRENIVWIDPQSNLGIIDQIIRGIEGIYDKMNGPACYFTSNQGSSHTHSYITISIVLSVECIIYSSAALWMYAQYVTMLPSSDLLYPSIKEIIQQMNLGGISTANEDEEQLLEAWKAALNSNDKLLKSINY